MVVAQDVPTSVDRLLGNLPLMCCQMSGRGVGRGTRQQQAGEVKLNMTVSKTTF